MPRSVCSALHEVNPNFKKSSGVKGQKWPKITKNCVSHSISQEAYIIWLWFLVHMCKMMASPDTIFIFVKFWFFGLIGYKKGKKSPKMTNNFACLTLYTRNCALHDCGFWCTCVKWWYLQQFFFKFWFFGFLGVDERAENVP